MSGTHLRVEKLIYKTIEALILGSEIQSLKGLANDCQLAIKPAYSSMNVCSLNIRLQIEN
jgi:hypothetical protein